LGGEHRIAEQTLDWQSGLPQKLQIKLGIVKDFDGGRLRQQSL
jgi:hypothetical protein